MAYALMWRVIRHLIRRDDVVVDVWFFGEITEEFFDWAYIKATKIKQASDEYFLRTSQLDDVVGDVWFPGGLAEKLFD